MKLEKSPVSLLKEAIKSRIEGDILFQRILVDKPSAVDLERFTDFSEQDVPIFTISVPSESIRPLSLYDDERSEITVIVQALLPRKIETEAGEILRVTAEDLAYYLRRRLLSMPAVRVPAGRFQVLSSSRIMTSRVTVGKIAAINIICEMKTVFDESILRDFAAVDLSRIEVEFKQ